MAEDDIKRKTDILLIGGSAGSLEVILHILRQLVQPSYPIIIILHRKGAADSVLAELLGSRSRMNVKEAEEKEPVEAGTVYLAPPDYHLLIEKDRTFSLDASEKVNFSRPSIDVTLECAAGIYGPGAVAVLLSGGSSDGTEGLYHIQQAGGLTVVQDPASAVVPYMPEYALSRIVPWQILNKEGLAAFVLHL